MIVRMKSQRHEDESHRLQVGAYVLTWWMLGLCGESRLESGMEPDEGYHITLQVLMEVMISDRINATNWSA